MIDSNMSSAVLINTVINLVTFISYIIWCMLYSFILAIQDFCSCFKLVFHLPFHLRLIFWESSRPPSSIGREGVSSSEPRPRIRMSGGDVKVVMKHLGLGHEEPLSQDSIDITSMFDREEPSLDEVREAFGIFDENKDGFVDAEELMKLMNALGLVGLSEQECQRMIMAFDDDGDGRISFKEFVKLIEENVCC